MATVNEQIVTGRKFRKLVNEATKLWQRISFWTKASDVEFDDAKTAEIKVGAIDGITDSLASTSSRIAASAKSVNQLSNNLGGLSFGETADGKPGYRKPGADAVIPFKSGMVFEHIFTFTTGYHSKNIHITSDSDAGYFFIYSYVVPNISTNNATIQRLEGYNGSNGAANNNYSFYAYKISPLKIGQIISITANTGSGGITAYFVY